MHRFIFIALIIFSFLFSKTPSKVFETQTAVVSDQGAYAFEFNFYNNGGVQGKAGLAISSFFELGVIEYIDGLIGKEKVTFNVPGVFAKIKFTDNAVEKWNFSFGYDALYSGSFSEYADKRYGVYGVFSKGFFFILPLPHVYSVGIVYPVVPDEGTLNFYSSIISSFNEMFSLGIELTSLSLEDRKNYNFINNWSFNFNLNEQFSIQFTLQLGSRNEYNAQDSLEKTIIDYSRNVRLVYGSFF